jgi:hypothetical protein
VTGIAKFAAPSFRAVISFGNNIRGAEEVPGGIQKNNIEKAVELGRDYQERKLHTAM